MKNRPAETGSVAASIVVLISYLFGLDNQSVLIALTVVIGFIPAAITWVVLLVRRDDNQ